jgi:hypothetical protein
LENKLSRGEICVANFIPPANGANQGSYVMQKADFGAKSNNRLTKTVLAAKQAITFRNAFYFWVDIQLSKNCKKIFLHTDRERHNIDTVYGDMCFF